MRLTYKKNIDLYVSANTLSICINNKEFFAKYDMYDIDLKEIPKGYFDLLMYILFYDLEKIDISKVNIKTTGDQSIISYSGGVDSTAILHGFGGIPVHINRSYAPDYEQKQLRAVKNVAAINIVTDFEKIRELYGKPHGFNVGVGYAALYMPLLPLLKANKISFGVVFDDLAFNFGRPFKFNQSFENSRLYKIRKLLNNFGIDFVLPLAGYSELLTTQIAAQSWIKNYSSCHTIGAGSECLQCIKCFRKKGALGQRIDISQSLLKARLKKLFSTYPLKMAAVTVYAVQKAGYTEFKNWFDIDVSFCERVNKTMTEKFFTGEKLPGFEWQTDKDIENIYKFVDFVNEKWRYE